MSNPLFDKAKETSEQEIDLSTITDDNAFKLLVGEEGKYKTPEALAKASFFREAHVKDLEKQIAELKAKTNEQMTISELLAKLDKTPAIVPPKPEERKMGETEETKSLDISKQVQELVAQELSKRTGESTKSLNVTKVVETLKANWGADFQAVLEAKATQLGATKEQLLELAASHPSVFLNAVGAQEKRNLDGSPTPSTVRLPSGTSGGVKNHKYYTDLRKKDPRAFNSPAIQKERFQMAAALGDKFFS
jgi:hypothetical protein